MNIEIRKLNSNDSLHVQNMQTNIEYDYVLQAFDHLITDSNVLYGLFADGVLASVAGYTTFQEQLAMLGRLRTDIRFHGHGFATELMAFVRDTALQQPNMKWVGANTQADNKPTRRVLEKINFNHHATLYNANTEDITALESNHPYWNKIDCLQRKKEWLKQVYLDKKAYFPYECYYTLPAIQTLFTEDTIEDWIFYENREQTRFITMKIDVKKQTYLHVTYPWDDLMEQNGLWETIRKEQQRFTKKNNTAVAIWMDLSNEAVLTLPNDHPFELPSPWMLYGMFR